MQSIRDPEALEAVQEHRHGEYGPSDTSDSASDVVGTESEATDSDANGTGERPSVEYIAPAQTEQDIPLDDKSAEDALALETDSDSDSEPDDESDSDSEDETGNLPDRDLKNLKSPHPADGSR